MNLHDAFFKNTFSYREIAQSYLTNFLDSQIVAHLDLDNMTLEGSSYVTPELAEYFSDLVWEVGYKETKVKVSFLFEHKSYVSPYPHLQLLRYILEHIEVQIKANQPLSVVIPIIIYHGEAEWKVRPFSDYFEGIDNLLLPYIPSFDYQLTNLSDYTDAELIEKGIGKLVNVFLALRHVRNLEYIKNNYEVIFVNTENFLESGEYSNFFQTIFVYLFKNVELSKEQFIKIVDNINKPLKTFTMSAYNNFIDEGIELGIELGIEQGEIKKTKKVIIGILNKFPEWSDLQIADLADTTIEFVEQVKNEIAAQN